MNCAPTQRQLAMPFGGILDLPRYILFGDQDQERKLRKRKLKLRRERKLRLRQERKLRQREQQLQWLLLRQQPRQRRGVQGFFSDSRAVPRGYEQQSCQAQKNACLQDGEQGVPQGWVPGVHQYEDFSASDDEEDDEDDDGEDDEDDDEDDDEVEEGNHRLMVLTLQQLQQGGQGVPRVHPGGRLERLY